MRFDGKHTYDRIAEELDGVRHRYNINADKIVAYVTDNGGLKFLSFICKKSVIEKTNPKKIENRTTLGVWITSE